MVRRRLSTQLVLLMLAGSLVPLGGTALLILRLIEDSVTAQVRAGQEQLATAAGALVRDTLRDATAKLKAIAALVKKGEDPQEQARRLNSLLDPPDLFLEVGFWTVDREAEVQAQVQQTDYNAAQTGNVFSNRAYNPKVNQQVFNWSRSSPILTEPSIGNDYVAAEIDTVGAFAGLPLSVPAPEGAVVTALLDFGTISRIFDTLSSDGRRRLLLLDRKGRPLASSREVPGAPFLEHAMPVGHGGWVLAVREPSERAMAPLRSAQRQALSWFGLAVALAIGLAVLFAGSVVRPVRALAAAADRIGTGDLDARARIDRKDEIGQLAKAFDRMADAVQQLDRMKGEFVAHVSHELRTPLTSAKAALANVQEGIGGPEALGRVQKDLDRLIRMVNELLDVARIEAGIGLSLRRADLGAVVRGAVETLRPLSRVGLAASGTGDTFEMDPARVQQIVVNLVDNGLKYAKSRVEVAVGGREVRVADDGPGVPPEHRERIFEKFSRVEEGPKPPGAGLGLSIARKLAELHGGSLVCEGNVFVLRL